MWGISTHMSVRNIGKLSAMKRSSENNDANSYIETLSMTEMETSLPVRKEVDNSFTHSQFVSDKSEQQDINAPEEKTQNKGLNLRSRQEYFIPPPGDVPVRRFPQAVIIGFGKCGTRAMLTFLSLHPYIVIHHEEVHFYTEDKLYAKGYKWYLNQMPFSYSNQVTMEKSPDYVCSNRARQEIAEHFPDCKLIVLVRNPVVRIVSAFLQRFRFKEPSQRPPMNVTYMNTKTNEFNPNASAVDVGIFHKHLSPWLRTFSRDNILVVSDESLTTDPLSVLKRAEKFLNIPPMLNEDNFYYNETSGFYCCRRYSTDEQPRCMNINKGWKHPELPADDEKMLYDFYRPHNKKLFKLLNETYNWEKT
ncbi:heparan sulfate glucosamine 3-O-sulfotransferase 1-like isoform X2 [Biomphalaria glabrata]|nr:heparan sulfate glucosamine 3-O-sulfotransferase 1-like isoform X2 [Biomphalaria glabrata]